MVSEAEMLNADVNNFFSIKAQIKHANPHSFATPVGIFGIFSFHMYENTSKVETVFKHFYS
ncbi:MAG TPA: hypothetical protein VER14_04965 [Phototrophicaceae bacterium]|nr:hypothetical protein [Phototrophicaceae bacterium]